jgi:hypothetical protein
MLEAGRPENDPDNAGRRGYPACYPTLDRRGMRSTPSGTGGRQPLTPGGPLSLAHSRGHACYAALGAHTLSPQEAHLHSKLTHDRFARIDPTDIGSI